MSDPNATPPISGFSAEAMYPSEIAASEDSQSGVTLSGLREQITNLTAELERKDEELAAKVDELLAAQIKCAELESALQRAESGIGHTATLLEVAGPEEFEVDIPFTEQGHDEGHRHRMSPRVAKAEEAQPVVPGYKESGPGAAESQRVKPFLEHSRPTPGAIKH